MVIQHNMPAMNAYGCFNSNNVNMASASEKLSSGYRINRAADDAAGLAVSEKMRSMIRGLNQANRNCKDAINLVQTAEGALDEVHSILRRMEELAVESANGNYDDSTDRAALQLEFGQLQDEIEHISESDFNGMSLFGGKYDPADSNTLTLKSLLSQNTGSLDNIIYTQTVYEFETTQTGETSNNFTNSTYINAANVLQTSIVPQAVQAIVSKYPAFNYLTGSSIGIGLRFYSDAGSSTLASVTLGTSYYSDGDGFTGSALSYQLSVNLGRADLSTAEGRSALESTICHEMIHAFMDESLTAGMSGITPTDNTKSQKFPSWFVEGMAQTASGPGNWAWAMGLRESSTTSDISTALGKSNYKLGSGTNYSEYGTGYLAAMYLGYLAAGGSTDLSNATGAASYISGGVSTFLGKMIAGKSLESTIKEVTGGKYSTISAFENGFATDTDALNFVKGLLENGYLTQIVDGNIASGGLVSGSLLGTDPLPDGTVSGLNLFKLDPNNQTVKNVYPDDVLVLSGGTKTDEGSASTGTAGSGGTGGGSGGGTGGTTGGGGTGGTTGGGGTGGTGSTGGTTGGGSSGGNGNTTKSGLTYNGGVWTMQVGSHTKDTLEMDIGKMNSKILGIHKEDVNISTQENANYAIDQIVSAINQLSRQRASIGAYQNRLEHKITNLTVTSENLSNSESSIRDTDMALTMMEFTKNQILTQSAQAMLGQANAAPQSVLSLFQ